MSLSIFNVSVGHCHLIKHKNKKISFIAVTKVSIALLEATTRQLHADRYRCMQCPVLSVGI